MTKLNLKNILNQIKVGNILQEKRLKRQVREDFPYLKKYCEKNEMKFERIEIYGGYSNRDEVCYRFNPGCGTIPPKVLRGYK